MTLLPRILFGTLREHYVLLFGMAGSISLLAGFIGAWVGSRFGARAAARRGLEDSSATQTRPPELRAIMEQLDAVGLEVERLAEGHRFVARLLSEQRDRPGALPGSATSPRREPGQITPH